MAIAKAGSKRKRKSKARTEVSSSSDSSSSNSSREQSPATPREPARQTSIPTHDEALAGGSSHSPPPSSRQSQTVDPQQAFSDFYLRQATKEFGDDLVTLRNAKDFSAAGVEVLVAALRGGEACFSTAERERVGGAVAAAAAAATATAATAEGEK